MRNYEMTSVVKYLNCVENDNLVDLNKEEIRKNLKKYLLQNLANDGSKKLTGLML